MMDKRLTLRGYTVLIHAIEKLNWTQTKLDSGNGIRKTRLNLCSDNKSKYYPRRNGEMFHTGCYIQRIPTDIYACLEKLMKPGAKHSKETKYIN